MAIDPTRNAPPVPTLDTRGWLTEPSEKADALLCHYLQSDYSQTTLMVGSVKSFQYTLQRHPKDPLQLREAVSRELNLLFDAHFEATNVSVTVQVPNDQDPQYESDAKYNVNITIDVTDNGVVHSVGKLISTIDSRVAKIIDLNKVK